MVSEVPKDKKFDGSATLPPGGSFREKQIASAINAPVGPQVSSLNVLAYVHALHVVSTMRPERTGWDKSGSQAARQAATQAVLDYMTGERYSELSSQSAAEVVAELRERRAEIGEALSDQAREELKKVLGDRLSGVIKNPTVLLVELKNANLLPTDTSVVPEWTTAQLDYRQDVIGAPTPRRKIDDEAVNDLDEIIAAARGTAIIHTVFPQNLSIATKLGPGYSPASGEQTFGDGSFQKNNEVPKHFSGKVRSNNSVTLVDGQKVYPPDMVEAAAFMPVVTKPGTVYFDYAYMPGLMGAAAFVEHNLRLPPYKESLRGGSQRSGNFLVVRIEVPQSLADKMQRDIEQSPRKARQIAEKVVLELGGVSEEQWSKGSIVSIWGSDYQTNRTRPPYEGLPAGHRLYMITPSELPPREGDFSWPPVARKIDVPFR